MHLKELSDIRLVKKIDKVMAACRSSRNDLKELVTELGEAPYGDVGVETWMNVAESIRRSRLMNIGAETVDSATDTNDGSEG